MDKQRVLLIGSEGFLGKYVQKILRTENLDCLLVPNEKIFFDLLKNRFIFDTIDTVVWTAGKATPLLAEIDPYCVDHEYKMWKSLLKVIPINTRVIFISSAGSIYDSTGDLISHEESKISPSNKYGILKIRMEEALIESRENFVILRVTNLYGPKQKIGRGLGVIGEWINSIQNNNSIHVFGSLMNSRDFIYVSDVVNAINLSIITDIKGIYNIGSGVSSTLNEVVNILRTVHFENFDLIFSDNRSFDRKKVNISVDKFIKATSWTPTKNLREGILLTYMNWK